MVSRTFFYIHHEIQMGFQHTISGSTESYPQSFPLGQRPCHPQQSFCFVSPCRPQLPGDCARSSHEVPSRELPQPRSISESQVPLFPIGMQLHNRRDGNTVEHQPPSAQWKTFGTSTDGLSGEAKDGETAMRRGFITPMTNNSRHNFFRLLNTEGEMFESKTGLFENTSSLASKRRNWDTALETGEVRREDRRTSHRRDADIRLQHRKLGWETCCVRHTHRRTRSLGGCGLGLGSCQSGQLPSLLTQAGTSGAP